MSVFHKKSFAYVIFYHIFLFIIPILTKRSVCCILLPHFKQDVTIQSLLFPITIQKGGLSMEEEKRILSILEEMNTRFDRTDERLEKIESRLAKTESDIRDLKLTVENDIRPAISIITEWQTKLGRNLSDDIRHNSDRLSDYEIVKLKINHLDSEVLKLNEKIMTSA